MHANLETLQQYLSIYHIPQLGVRSYHKLLSAFSSPANILSATDKQLIAAGLKKPPLKSLRSFINDHNQEVTDKVNKDLTWLHQL